jgi:RNA 2',3'-cyclic 3'-phosphodiesterase
LAPDRTELVGAGQLAEAPPLKLRAFFGLPLPEEQRGELGHYLASCAALAPDLRWVAAANLHLTVRFIGNVERELVEGIAGRLAEQRLRGFDLELGEMGTFRRGRLVRVVWIGLRGGLDAAAGLAAAVEAECGRAGLEPEARPFQPHLTLARARARDGAVLPALPAAPALAPWRAKELVLYQSRLGRAGAVYEPLRRLRLD